MIKRICTILTYVLLLLNFPAIAKSNGNDHALMSGSFQTEVTVSVAPTQKQSRFNDKSGVSYILKIRNKMKEEQTGEIVYIISNERGSEIFHKSFDVHVPSNGKLSQKLLIPHQTDGTFTIVFQIGLTNISTSYTDRFVYAHGKLPKAAPAGKKQSKIKKVTLDQDKKQKKTSEEEIKLVLKPNHPDGTFHANDQIVYAGSIKSTYKEPQEGTISYTVKEQVTGALVTSKTYDIRMRKKSGRSLKFDLVPPSVPGIYNVDVAVNTTTYDDTVRYTFGYEVDYINSPFHKPADFDEFWAKALSDLAGVYPDYKIEKSYTKSTLEHWVYHVEMTSLDSVRIDGWLTIPRTLIKGKNFPVAVFYPGYETTMKPLFAQDYATLGINTRGTDKKNEAYPIPPGDQVLTYQIQDINKYVYRGLYMDCVRAIDFLFANREMGFDLSRIVVAGGSQGGALALVTAALKNDVVKACVSDVPIYCDMFQHQQMAPQIDPEKTFVVKYVQQFLAKTGSGFTMNDFLNNFSYFEVQNFMPKIKGSVLMATSFLDLMAPATTVFDAFNKLSPYVRKNSEIYTFPQYAHEVPDIHNRYKFMWMTENITRGLKK